MNSFILKSKNLFKFDLFFVDLSNSCRKAGDEGLALLSLFKQGELIVCYCYLCGSIVALNVFFCLFVLTE